MITARSAGEPVTASVTLSMIGCVRLKFAPGICARNLAEIWSTRFALRMPLGQVSYGFSATKNSLRLGP